MGFLDNSQTYVGVLATFVVLCLFVARKNETSNFIIFTILKIAEESISHIDQHIDELKQKFSSVWDAKSKGDNNLKELVDSIEDVDTKNKLSNKAVDIKLVPFNFNAEAQTLANNYQPTEAFKNKEELPYISLYTLLTIILVMFLDCLCFIPLCVRCRIVNFMLISSTIYTGVLYHKFLVDVSEGEQNKTFDKPNRIIIVGGLFLTFVIWNMLSLVVVSPLVNYLLLWVSLGVWGGLSKRKWIKLAHRFEKYNRRFVITHFVYIALFSISCAAFTYILNISLDVTGDNGVYFKNWENNIKVFDSVDMAKYFSIAFFTLNSIALPLLMGYCFLYRREKNVLKRISNVQNTYTQLNDKLLREYDLLKAEARRKRPVQSV